MQGKKVLTPQLFYQIDLEQLVPADNIYRQLNRTLDFRYLYKATALYYGQEVQQSIDPVVFFKMLLVACLNNINSDRALIRFCADSLSIRLFLGYNIQEQLPYHSTISRTRQLFGEQTFLRLFQQALKMCIDKGMVRGKRQCVDSAFIKANASMNSLMEKEVLDDASAFVDELEENSHTTCSFSGALPKPRPILDTKPSTNIKTLHYKSLHHCANKLLAVRSFSFNSSLL